MVAIFYDPSNDPAHAQATTLRGRKETMRTTSRGLCLPDRLRDAKRCDKYAPRDEPVEQPLD